MCVFISMTSRNVQNSSSDMLSGQHTKATRIIRSHQKQNLDGKVCPQAVSHWRFKAEPSFLRLQGLWVGSARSGGARSSARQARCAVHPHQVWKSAQRLESSLKSAVRLHLARRSRSRRAWLSSIDVLRPASRFLLLHTRRCRNHQQHARAHTHTHA